MKEINFFTEEINFKVDQEKKVKGWIEQVISSEGKLLGEVNYILCSDQYLHSINKEYLDHDTFTDIITFDMSEEAQEITGDIFISIDRIKENAQSLGVTFTDEFHRVLIHGILHLIGYTDTTQAEKDAMRQKEEACLSLR